MLFSKKQRGFFREKVDALRITDQHKGRSSVAVLCRQFGVSRGGYYAWLKRGISRRQIEDDNLLGKIMKVHRESREVYGYPSVHEALKTEGVICGRNRVSRLMRKNGIAARIARRFKRHSHRHELFRGTTNLLLDREPVTALTRCGLEMSPTSGLVRDSLI